MNTEAIEAIARDMEAYQLAKWENMPDLELYMDQVIAYLTRQLSYFQDSTQDALITPSIINNYVKAGFVPRPHKKRYARPQLGALSIACTLKRVMPIQSVKRLIERDGMSVDETFYDEFCQVQRVEMNAEAEHLKSLAAQEADREGDGRARMYRLAMHFALRANADRLIADRLMALLDAERPQEGNN